MIDAANRPPRSSASVDSTRCAAVSTSDAATTTSSVDASRCGDIRFRTAVNAAASQHRTAGPVEQRVDRGERGVGDQLGEAGVPAADREPQQHRLWAARAAGTPPASAASAAAAGGCPTGRRAPGRPRWRTPGPRPSSPRRPAPDSRAPRSRRRWSRPSAGSAPAGTRSGRCAPPSRTPSRPPAGCRRAAAPASPPGPCRRRPASRRRRPPRTSSAGAPGSRLVSKSPGCTTTPVSAVSAAASWSGSATGQAVGGDPLQRRRREVRHRHERPAQRLGQRPDQADREIRPQPRHLGCEVFGRHPLQHGQRDGHGDAVVGPGRVEHVLQVQVDPGAGDAVRERVRVDVGGTGGDQVGLGEGQPRLLVRRRPAEPGVEVRAPTAPAPEPARRTARTGSRRRRRCRGGGRGPRARRSARAAPGCAGRTGAGSASRPRPARAG